MGAEEQEEQALVTGRPTTIIYSGDWPPEQAPRGLFKRYEVRGRVCEVIPHILFLRKDDASAANGAATFSDSGRASTGSHSASGNGNAQRRSLLRLWRVRVRDG